MLKRVWGELGEETVVIDTCSLLGDTAMALPTPGKVHIGFSTQKGALSWFIRKATRSPASHSFLLFFSEQFGQHMILEVQGRGFVQVPFEVWKAKNKLLALYEIKREDKITAGAMQLLGHRLGALYDNWSLLGFLLIYVVRIWDRNDLDDKKKLVCSEMVALFLRWCRVPLQTHIDRVVPRDLWRLAETHADCFQLAYSSERGARCLTKVKTMGRKLTSSVPTSPTKRPTGPLPLVE
mgnify:CR=1 FL=1|tara:strand:+ start:5229 stop:5939 length:711 start_codon:yes stop_codon:yes gene_type:complete